MHMVRDRPHVVEELRIDRPLAVLLEHRLADEPRASLVDRVLQQELLAFERCEAQPLVPDAAFVRRLGGAREPTLVNAAAVGAVGVQIGRMQLDPASRMQEAPRHPGRREPQQAAALIERLIENLGHIVLLDDFRGDHDARSLQCAWARLNAG